MIKELIKGFTSPGAVKFDKFCKRAIVVTLVVLAIVSLIPTAMFPGGISIAVFLRIYFDALINAGLPFIVLVVTAKIVHGWFIMFKAAQAAKLNMSAVQDKVSKAEDRAASPL